MSDAYVGLMLPENDPLFKGIKNPHVTLAYFPDTTVDELSESLGFLVPCGPVQLSITGTMLWAVRSERDGKPLWISGYTVESTVHHSYLDELRQDVVFSALDANIEADEKYRFTPHITRKILTNWLDVVNHGGSVVEPGLLYTIDHLTVKQVGGSQREDIPLGKGK
jgi:2'-5' RNA ligase